MCNQLMISPRIRTRLMLGLATDNKGPVQNRYHLLAENTVCNVVLGEGLDHLIDILNNICLQPFVFF